MDWTATVCRVVCVVAAAVRAASTPHMAHCLVSQCQQLIGLLCRVDESEEHCARRPIQNMFKEAMLLGVVAVPQPAVSQRFVRQAR